jgi:hypothetical protein
MAPGENAQHQAFNHQVLPDDYLGQFSPNVAVNGSEVVDGQYIGIGGAWGGVSFLHEMK